MKYRYIYFSLIFILISCASNKIKVFNLHSVKREGPRIKNYYLKDLNRSFETLKGVWKWNDERDTLVLKIVPKYKVPYQTDSKDFKINDQERKKFNSNSFFEKKNTFYDKADILIKYIKDGEIIIDQILTNDFSSELEVLNFDVYTKWYHVRKNKRMLGSFQLLFDHNSLDFISFFPEETVILSENKDKEIEVPRSFLMKRVQ